MAPRLSATLLEEAFARIRATHTRTLRAWERAQKLSAQSRRLLRSIRRPATSAIPANDHIVWGTDDGNIRCLVVPHSFDVHELVVILRGKVFSSRSFADPVEATDESVRLRQFFFLGEEFSIDRGGIGS